VAGRPRRRSLTFRDGSARLPVRPARSLRARAGDWKLLEYYEDHRLELYNLREDLGEKSNLAGTMGDKASQLRDRLHGWLKAVGAQMPTAH
jgi:hypothetical protein